MREIKPTIATIGATRLKWIWVLAAGLVMGIAPAANAHDPGHRAGHHLVQAHAVAHAPKYPRWLRKHGAFRQWYLHSHHYHRYARTGHRHVDWHRLYDLYLIDRYRVLRSEGHRRHHDRDGYRADNRARPRVRHRHDGD